MTTQSTALSALSEAREHLLIATLSIATAAFAIDGQQSTDIRELGYRLDTLISDVGRMRASIEDTAAVVS